MNAPLLVATDLSAASFRALEAADSLCRRTEAPLVVCHVIPDESTAVSILFPQDFDPLPSDADLVAADRAVREQVRAATGREGPELTLRIGHGVAAEVVAKLADELAAELIVVGESDKGVLARAAVGSTTEALAKGAGASLLVVRAGDADGAIVAAVETGAADVARAYAEEREAALILVRAKDLATAAAERDAALIVVDAASEDDDPVDIIRRAPCSVLVIRGSGRSFGALG